MEKRYQLVRNTIFYKLPTDLLNLIFNYLESIYEYENKRKLIDEYNMFRRFCGNGCCFDLDSVLMLVRRKKNDINSIVCKSDGSVVIVEDEDDESLITTTKRKIRIMRLIGNDLYIEIHNIAPTQPLPNDLGVIHIFDTTTLDSSRYLASISSEPSIL
jgi:hypothetical protein